MKPPLERRSSARLTTAGSVYLALVAAVPLVALASAGGASAQAAFGGTSLLILVGVSLETVKQLEAHTRNYNLPSFMSRSERF